MMRMLLISSSKSRNDILDALKFRALFVSFSIFFLVRVKCLECITDERSLIPGYGFHEDGLKVKS